MKQLKIFVGLKCLVVATTLMLGACAVGSDMPDHAFEFDTWIDSPGAEVLDYQYGNSRQPGVKPSEEALRLHQVGQQAIVNGPMLRGDFLYVKWRIRKTGQVFEDRVDLRHRLPKDLTGCRVHFVIDGSHLLVYVITPEKVTGLCPSDSQQAYRITPPQKQIFIEYCSRKIIQIYPDRSNVSDTAG
ncbi:hypothetical protein [Trinickia acidisoli]|uniref:hypothetical protein n=1 Tax=Trinickia acidisoli TaxID=2767482 RepID=UPI001A8F2EE2|nr:hypothetical protein [Trinickia acidisoli]